MNRLKSQDLIETFQTARIARYKAKLRSEEAFEIEEHKFVCSELEEIIRNGALAPDELAIAKSMLSFYSARNYVSGFED